MRLGDRFLQFFFSDVLNDFIDRDDQTMAGGGGLLSLPFREYRPAHGIALQNHDSLLAMELRLIPPLNPLKPFSIHPGKSQHMSQERTLGIESSALHHQPDSFHRHVLETVPLFRIQLPSQPHETAILAQLLLQFVGSNMQHRRERPGRLGRTFERSRNAEHGGHFHIHGEHFAVTIHNGPSSSLKRHGLLMLTVGLGRELSGLKHLQVHQPEQHHRKSAEHHQQQHIPSAP